MDLLFQNWANGSGFIRSLLRAVLQSSAFPIHLTSGTVPGAFPELVRHGSPALGGRFALNGKIAHVFGAFQVGRAGAGVSHHGRQRAGIIQQGTGAQMVFIEGLPSPIGHK